MYRLSLLLLMSSLHASPLNYPAAVRSDLKETLHGVEIADPYCGLEEIDSAETRAWVEASAACECGADGDAVDLRKALVGRLLRVRVVGRSAFS